MTKSMILMALATLAAAPALAQQAPAEPKKCCCDKDGKEKMDHSKMDHGSMGKGTTPAPATPQ